MTVLDVAPDNCFASLEDTFFSEGKITDNILFIYKSDVNGKMVKNEANLLVISKHVPFKRFSYM
jgi:hypothetical protein